MEKNYMVSVRGVQVVDGERDEIELTTEAKYRFGRDTAYVGYKEYDTENPSVTTDLLIKAEGQNRVTISRGQGKQMKMILVPGQSHETHYVTAMGDMQLRLNAVSIENGLDEHGGTLDLKYTIDFNLQEVSANELHITVKEKNNEHIH